MNGLYRTDIEALDECLRLMFPNLDPEVFRTEGGSINMPKVRSLWREQPDMALMLLLSARFGVCVGKGMGGDAYVGRPGTKDVILTFAEGTGASAPTAELLAVIRAIANVTSGVPVSRGQTFSGQPLPPTNLTKGTS
jgi:hypothetical protein